MIGGSCDGTCGLMLGGGRRSRSKSRSASRRAASRSASRKSRGASRSRRYKGGNCSDESDDSRSCKGGARGKKLEAESKKDLYAKAKKYGIKGRSTMKKNELAAAVRAHQKSVGDAISRRGKKRST